MDDTSRDLRGSSVWDIGILFQTASSEVSGPTLLVLETGSEFASKFGRIELPLSRNLVCKKAAHVKLVACLKLPR